MPTSKEQRIKNLEYDINNLKAKLSILETDISGLRESLGKSNLIRLEYITGKGYFCHPSDFPNRLTLLAKAVGYEFYTVEHKLPIEVKIKAIVETGLDQG